MTRMRFALAALALAAAVAVPAALAATPTIKGVVGPGTNITLTKGGKKVSSLTAGTYKLSVSDKSGIHNFHLSGPGVNVKTGVGFTGTKSFTVKLKKGTYKYVCDPHASFMKGSFKVK